MSALEPVLRQERAQNNSRVPAADRNFEPDFFLLGQRQVEQILGRGKDLPDLGRRQAGAGVLDV